MYVCFGLEWTISATIGRHRKIKDFQVQVFDWDFPKPDRDNKQNTQNNHGGNYGISVWSGEKQFELSDKLSEQRESVKVFLRQRCLC